MLTEEPFELSGTLGFITNSSSVIHFFPPEVLNHPDVQAVLRTFGVQGGFVGDELWNRSLCSSVLITDEQKELAYEMLAESDYSSPPCDKETLMQPGVVVIYGDEYQGLARSLCNVMQNLAEELKIPCYGGLDYN